MPSRPTAPRASARRSWWRRPARARRSSAWRSCVARARPRWCSVPPRPSRASCRTSSRCSASAAPTSTLGRGHADYGRFVRRHSHLHAPCEDGTIETGPSHVHPELSPYGPPSEDRFTAINVEQQDRAGDRDAARERWGVGLPYRGVDLDALVVRGAGRAGDGVAAPGSVVLRDVAPLGRGWWTAPLAFAGIGARRRYPAQLPLEWATAAVCEAYVALGELTAEAMASTQFAVRPEGWVRISLPGASVESSRAVSAAVDELLGGSGCRGTRCRGALWERVGDRGWCGTWCRATWRGIAIGRRRSGWRGCGGWERRVTGPRSSVHPL